MIEGPPRLEELDLLAQRRVGRLTRRIVREMLEPGWMRTEPVLNHARLYFPDFALGGDGDGEGQRDGARSGAQVEQAALAGEGRAL